MTDHLPIIPTHTIGSHAWPAWLFTALEAMQRGEYGPKDWQETQDDAVDTALRDQEDAGVDIVTDGEMRRIGFFTAFFYDHLTGLTERPPQRKVGIPGHDQREGYLAVEALRAPDGLGLVAEFDYLRGRTTRPIKLPVPGPYTLAGRIAPGSVYTDRLEVAYALSDIINAELIQPQGHTDFTGRGKRNTFPLHAVTQGRIIDLDVLHGLTLHLFRRINYKTRVLQEFRIQETEFRINTNH